MAAVGGKQALRAPALPPPRTAPIVSVVAAPVRSAASSLQVSAPNDPAEREAVAVAKRVMRMPVPTADAVSRSSPWVARLASQIVQRQATGTPTVSSEAAASIGAARGGGQPLPPSVRGFMEPRFGADFSNVRVHADARAAGLSRQLRAQAFTVGQDVFFARGDFQPESADGRELIAHELAHTLQQGGATRRDAEPAAVRERSVPQVQRLGLDDARAWIAERAAALPGWRLLTLVLGADPITHQAVARPARALLRAALELIPFGMQIEQGLDRYGLVDRAARWAEASLADAVRLGRLLREGVTRFLLTLGAADLMSPLQAWFRARSLAGEPARQVVALAAGILPALAALLREGAFASIAPLLQGTRGWPLLSAVLGVDPSSGRAVPRDASVLLAGFMVLAGQEAVWVRIQQARAEGRAGAWFLRTLDGLAGVVRPLPQALSALWQSLGIADLVDPRRAFSSAASIFAGVAERFAAWGLGSVTGLLELVLSTLAPQAWPWLQGLGAALAEVVRDPAAFARRLSLAVEAALHTLARRAVEIATRAFAVATGLVGPWLELALAVAAGVAAAALHVGETLATAASDLAAAAGLDRLVQFALTQWLAVAGLARTVFTQFSSVARGQAQAISAQAQVMVLWCWRQALRLFAGLARRADIATRALQTLDRAGPIDLTGRVREIFGVRYFRSREGRWEQLPSDMSAEEVARREDEAAQLLPRIEAAEARTPRPAPKSLVPAAKPGARSQRFAGERRAGARRAASVAALAQSAAAALHAAAGDRPVARYLVRLGAPVLARGVVRTQGLRRHEQTHLDAATKRDQAEQAVQIPRSDEQSKGNSAQVGAVAQRAAPLPDAGRARVALGRSLERHLPRSLDEVDHFKRDARAQRTTAEVAPLVHGDKDAVEGNFGDMRQTPQPVPSGHVPQALPAPEAAPATAALQLGQGLLAPLAKEHLDTSAYTRDADRKLDEEGVTQPQLDMVDSGELLDARREKSGLERSARDEPVAAQKFALAQTKTLDAQLQADERRERGAMRAQRNAGLGRTGRRQQDAKSAHERQREEVAQHINGVYERAQTSVKTKLDALERESMRRFDQGNAAAAQRFENQVKDDLEAYKSDRYSGFFGKLRKVRDWWKGMDDLPGVKRIFERNRQTFVDTVQRLVDQIAADDRRVIEGCKQELADARRQIADYVAKLDRGLRDIGQQAAREMGERLQAMDEAVAKKEQDLRQQLQDKQQAAIKAIDDKIEKMKEAMAGALAKLGKLLLWAAKKFFSWALGKFGMSLSDIESIISKGVAVLKAIFTQPIRFVKNLIGAAKEGFANFRDHFVDHLKDALFEWLTGSLGGLRLPAAWNARGLLDVALQVLRISGDVIRRKLLLKLGGDERLLAAIERVTPIVQRVFKEGPAAAWEQIQAEAEQLQTQMVKQLTEWVTVEVVKKAVTTVLAMFVPGAGIVRAIVGIYDTVMFFIRRAAEIARMVGNFLGSISDIAAGNLAAAAAALENGLAQALKLVIDFLARFLKLDGIPSKVRGVIEAVAGRVEAVVDRVVDWLGSGGRRTIARDTSATSPIRGPVLDALQQELTTEHSLTQAAAIVSGIGTRMKARGVRRLALGPRAASGEIEILLETNPTASVATLRPGGAIPRGRAVRANIELLLRPAVPGAVSATDPRLAARLGTGDAAGETKGKESQAFFRIGSSHEQARTRSASDKAVGGIVLVPDENRVQVVTWNTSSMSLQSPGNDTHAESQFDHWIRRVAGTEFGLSFLGRVYQVDMHLRDYSPCGMCIDMLRGTYKLFPAIASANLYWYEFYPGWVSPTTWSGLRRLQSAGWTLHAPGTAMPPEQNLDNVQVKLVNKPR